MKSLVFLFCFFSMHLFADPYRIIIIPPAETPSKNSPYCHTAIAPSGPFYGQSLTARGQREAAALVATFLGMPGKKPLFADMVSTHPSEDPRHPISYIAAYSSEGGKRTLSAIETITPLANVIFYQEAPMRVYDYAPATVRQFTSKRVPEIQRDLKKISGTAVICWLKEEIPSLLKQLEPRIEPVSPQQSRHAIFVITYEQGTPFLKVY